MLAERRPPGVEDELTVLWDRSSLADGGLVLAAGTDWPTRVVSFSPAESGAGLLGDSVQLMQVVGCLLSCPALKWS